MENEKVKPRLERVVISLISGLIVLSAPVYAQTAAHSKEAETAVYVLRENARKLRELENKFEMIRQSPDIKWTRGIFANQRILVSCRYCVQ